jgi:hypothetical protein
MLNNYQPPPGTSGPAELDALSAMLAAYQQR